jgi:hypothetical protein
VLVALRRRDYDCEMILLAVCDLMMDIALDAETDVAGAFLAHRCTELIGIWKLKRMTGPVC